MIRRRGPRQASFRSYRQVSAPFSAVTVTRVTERPTGPVRNAFLENAPRRICLPAVDGALHDVAEALATVERGIFATVKLLRVVLVLPLDVMRFLTGNIFRAGYTHVCIILHTLRLI